MGMIASLFTAVLAINVFKDSNEEGTELIIISKPISRFKIVATKFVLFGIFCLMINLSTVILSAFTIFLPRTESQFYVGLLVSMFIGNAVTFAIFGSISILLTVNFAKIGVIITNIIISLLFLIYQTLTLFVFSTPAKIMDDNYMSASSYIIQDRNTKTGEYAEDEVVQFIPSSVSADKSHPCQAKSWEDMKKFWQENIMSKDITPVLNATDWAGQMALTYLSYNTNKYAERQAHRMFALSRFYNYQLTSPASPEIITGTKGRKSIDWLYTAEASLPIGEDESLYIPGTFGFAGIPPLSATRLRGYTDQIPVGTVRSKELLSSRDVYFEKEDWKKFHDGFQTMYEEIFNYKNYGNIPSGWEDAVDWPILFSRNNDTLGHYYDLVWYCFMGQGAEQMPEIESQMGKYSKKYFEINSIDDLNNRFMQFKNYVYWQILDEQSSRIHDLSLSSDAERTARAEVLADGTMSALAYLLGMKYDENSWMMQCLPNKIDGFISENTQAPSINLMNSVWPQLKIDLGGISSDDYKEEAQKCTVAVMQKTARIFNYVCSPSENYLYSSLSAPNRTSKYSGEIYTVRDNWYPNLKWASLQEVFPISLPLGQNIQYFFYDTKPTLNYWLFAVIWGSISLALFAAGIVVYNKYDVK